MSCRSLAGGRVAIGTREGLVGSRASTPTRRSGTIRPDWMTFSSGRRRNCKSGRRASRGREWMRRGQRMTMISWSSMRSSMTSKYSIRLMERLVPVARSTMEMKCNSLVKCIPLLLQVRYITFIHVSLFFIRHSNNGPQGWNGAGIGHGASSNFIAVKL